MIRQDKLQRICQLAIIFLKLGCIGFGGMAVIIAMIEEEAVAKHKWLTREQFLDFVGASNIIPGATAVELALQIGLLQAGWWGFAVAGICFTVPATLITIGCAWAYVKFGSLPQVIHIWNGIRPVIPAVILVAVWNLGKAAIKNEYLPAIGLVVIFAQILGANEMAAIVIGGVLGMFWLHLYKRSPDLNHKQEMNEMKSDNFFISTRIEVLLIILYALLLLVGLVVVLVLIWNSEIANLPNWNLAATCIILASAYVLVLNEMLDVFLNGIVGEFWLRFYQRIVAISVMFLLAVLAINLVTSNNLELWKLSLFFLKVGSLLYGGGYILVAFLQGGLSNELSWLTPQQLFDAIAVGQVTPGPVLSTATFVGYLLSGIPSALMATVSIFLPAFLFSAAIHPVIPQLRRSRWTSDFLDAVNVSSIALMATVTIKLSQSALINWQSCFIALNACILRFYFKVNVSLVILAGAIAGWILFSL